MEAKKEVKKAAAVVPPKPAPQEEEDEGIELIAQQKVVPQPKAEEKPKKADEEELSSLGISEEEDEPVKKPEISAKPKEGLKDIFKETEKKVVPVPKKPEAKKEQKKEIKKIEAKKPEIKKVEQKKEAKKVAPAKKVEQKKEVKKVETKKTEPKNKDDLSDIEFSESEKPESSVDLSDIDAQPEERKETEEIIEKLEEKVEQAEEPMKDEEEKAAPAEKPEPTKKQAEPVKKPEVKKEEPFSNEVELFVGNLPGTVTEESLAEFFQTYGPIGNVKVLMREMKPTGKAFVQFQNPDDAAKARKAGNLAFEGNQLEIRYSIEPAPFKPEGTPLRKLGSGQPATAEGKTVFIGNMSYFSTEDSVGEFFSQAGNVTQVRLSRDPATGNLRGFGHVEFETEEAAKNAIKLSGQEMDGKQIRVELAGSKGTTPGRMATPSRGGFRGNQRGAASPFRGVSRFVKAGEGPKEETPAKNKMPAFQGKKTKLD